MKTTIKLLLCLVAVGAVSTAYMSTNKTFVDMIKSNIESLSYDEFDGGLPFILAGPRKDITVPCPVIKYDKEKGGWIQTSEERPSHVCTNTNSDITCAPPTPCQ